MVKFNGASNHIIVGIDVCTLYFVLLACSDKRVLHHLHQLLSA